ncbi:MAG: aldo/keto reductase [Oscillospiraceae bacterium]|nr:aldo/keto reductase [Oscillospiraceae bacterium]
MSYLGENIPKLGFGLMRLPKVEGNVIDSEETKKMIDKFIAAGGTYYDTAYIYEGSECAAKECLIERYPRDSFYLATKLAGWDCKDAEEAKQMFYTSLERSGAGYFDFYLLHSLGGNRTAMYEERGMWDLVKQLKEEGLVKHIGFSFHDTADSLEEILKAHPETEFVQLQINYADWEDDKIQSRRCYEVARKYNKPVVIMEPVKGGTLAVMPDKIGGPFKKARPDDSYASWAIRFAASLDGVITVLSGMSTMEQMEDNLKTMKNLGPLTETDRAVFAEVAENMEKADKIPCTSCEYCVKGCPQNIKINGIFGAMNKLLVFENRDAAMGDYAWITSNGGKASECIGCGACEAVCPQELNIVDLLKRCADELEV